jgi:hypothetical protein
MRGSILAILLSSIVSPALSASSLGFEAMTRMSDLIVLGTVKGTGAGQVELSEGKTIPLGVKDDVSGLVFTPTRVRVSECLFDTKASCAPGDIDVFIPGGTLYERVNGERRLRTWEVSGGAGAPLPPVGESVLLFMLRKNGRYVPINDPEARLPVDRSQGAPRFLLRFASPRFLSSEAAESIRGDAFSKAAPPELIESVDLERLRVLIALARQVPTSTSGTRHAIAGRDVALVAHAVQQRRVRVRAGKVTDRRQPTLAVGFDPGPAHRPDDGRRAGRP